MDKNLLKQIKQFQRLRFKAQEKGNLKEEAEYVNFLGELHSKIGEDDQALQLHKEELRICESLSDKIGVAVAHRKIGECYAALGNFTKALHHQYKHLELGKVAGSLPEQQRAYATIGRTYLIQGEDCHNAENYDEARPLLLKAENAFKSSIQLSQKIQETKSLSEKEVQLMKTRGISNLAYVFHFLSLESDEDFDGDYSRRSLALYKKALLISQKRMLSDETHRAHIQLTMYYRCRGRMDDALQHAEEAIRCAKVAKNITWQIEALGELASIQIQNGNCELAIKAYKKCYRLSNDPDSKSDYRDKLKPVLKIHALQNKVNDSALTSEDKFKIYERIADKFCDLGCYQAAINNYKEQENLFSSAENLTLKQKAAVYYSLGLTSSDLNDHRSAVEYFHKEMECYSNPNELAKTWTQIGISTEKLSNDLKEVEECFKKAVEYAGQTSEAKLQLRALNLLLETQEKRKNPEVSETRQKISELQLNSGILLADGEEDSEDMNAKNQEQEKENESDDEDVDVLVDKELELNSDDSDCESSRKSRMNSKVWKKKLNEKGETPLHRACIDGHMKRVQLLLEQKHPVNEADYAGWTPLHEACIHGFTEIVRLLIDHGANMNYKANCGTTPMQDAASNGHLEIVALLLEKGASPSLRNNKGDTALSNLEYYFQSVDGKLDAYDTESYWKIHQTLKSHQKGTAEEDTSHDFAATLGTMGDIFDSEICTQQVRTQNSELHSSTVLRETQNSSFSTTQRNFDKHLPKMSQKIDDFDPNFESDPIFDDANILPTFESAVNPRKSTFTSSQDFTAENSQVGANEYKNVMARLGGADSLSRMSKTTSRAAKRPSNDDLRGLVSQDEYVGDDWLVEDVEESSSTGFSKNRSKRPKTANLGDFGNLGWRKNNSVRSKSGKSNSGEFSSTFLNGNGIRENSGKNIPKKSKSTNIRDYLPDPVDDVIIDDDDLPVSAHRGNSTQNVAPQASYVDQHPKESIAPMTVEPTQPTQNTTMRIKVKINGKMFLIAVPGRTKTIGWLCERAALVYKQSTGLEPKLALYTGGDSIESDACLLPHDDLVSEILQSNEHVTAKIESWQTVPLSKKYEESCTARKQAVHPVLLSACFTLPTTGKLDIRNQGLLVNHLEPLVCSITQQQISSITLPGNSLRDSGMASLCEALQKQMTLNLPGFQCLLTELNLKCTNLRQDGLKKLAATASAGALKNLRSLDISCNRFGDYCLDELSSILRFCKKMSKLSASRCRFSHKLFHANYPEFKAAMQGSFLSSLDMSHNTFGSVGCELLLKSLPHCSITEITLSGVCDIKNTLLSRHIISYLKKEDCSLQTLHLAQNQLSLIQLKEFAIELRSISKLSLRAINLSRNVNIEEETELTLLLNSVECIEEFSVDCNHFCWKKNRPLLNLKERYINEFDSTIIPKNPLSAQ